MPNRRILFPGWVPPSAIAGAPFPALVSPKRGVMMSLLAQLAETQWWHPSQLRQAQLTQLSALVQHAARTTPYGQRHFPDLATTPLTWERWATLPILGRRTVQQEAPSLRSLQVPEGHGQGQVAESSGSSGTPVVVQRTGVVHLFWDVLTARENLWHERDTRRRLSVVRYMPQAAYPAGAVSPKWGTGADLIGPPGECRMLHVGATTGQQLAWLRRYPPDYLLLYPSGLRDLVRLAGKEGVRFPSLRQVRTFGEVVDPDLRAEVREAWGVEIADLYSTQEVGYIALQCPGRTHYHVQSEAVLVEVLDDAGRPVGPGQQGRVIVTPLHNFAMPLLRYEIGDFAVVGADCDCGRGLPVLERIVGRVHETFVTADGDRLWLTVGVHKLRSLGPVMQHQMVQRRLGALEVRLVPDRPPTAAETAALRAHFVSALPTGTEVTLVWVDAIPRTARGKFLDFVSELPR